ncbi:MAG: hypothetical protein AAF513_13690 [Pseudomonadota bacterium]
MNSSDSNYVWLPIARNLLPEHWRLPRVRIWSTRLMLHRAPPHAEGRCPEPQPAQRRRSQRPRPLPRPLATPFLDGGQGA